MVLKRPTTGMLMKSYKSDKLKSKIDFKIIDINKVLGFCNKDFSC